MFRWTESGLILIKLAISRRLTSTVKSNMVSDGAARHMFTGNNGVIAFGLYLLNGLAVYSSLFKNESFLATAFKYLFVPLPYFRFHSWNVMRLSKQVRLLLKHCEIGDDDIQWQILETLQWRHAFNVHSWWRLHM